MVTPGHLSLYSLAHCPYLCDLIGGFEHSTCVANQRDFVNRMAWRPIDKIGVGEFIVIIPFSQKFLLGIKLSPISLPSLIG